MRKTLSLIALVLMAGCASGPKTDAARPLFEVLTQQEYGGAKIQFYEILDQPNEIRMLLNDPKLKGKVQQNDLQTATFVLLNLGEKNTGGYGITVESAQELPDKIILKIKQTAPDGMATMALTQPFAVVRINSKKPVEFAE